ncbi:ammecr1 protein [Phycomyces nitens]|nr:ammecr1 protein [Phycomyces nitens]
MAATKEHCFYCFDVLLAHLKRQATPAANFQNESFPLFVTWNIIDHGQKNLRGCIGSFKPLPLVQGLKQFALTSALQDSRFPPISLKETPHLTCAVSLLINFEQADNYLDWEIGKHGIWIEFKDINGMTSTATYLPEVMPEQGWTKQETIHSLLRKGSFHGQITPEFCKTIKLTRYQSSKMEVTRQEYDQSRGV